MLIKLNDRSCIATPSSGILGFVIPGNELNHKAVLYLFEILKRYIPVRTSRYTNIIQCSQENKIASSKPQPSPYPPTLLQTKNSNSNNT